jgi:hypothetical protein
MQKFSGIDLHSNNSVVVVSDEQDRIVYQRRLANDLAEIVQALEPHREELTSGRTLLLSSTIRGGHLRHNRSFRSARERRVGSWRDW